MAEDRDKKGGSGEAGTELELPDETSGSPPVKPSSNMSFGMLDLGGSSSAGADLPPPEAVQSPPVAQKPAPKRKPSPKPEPESRPEPPPAKPKPTTEAKPAPYTIKSQRTHSTPTGLPMARASRIREESFQAEVPSSNSSSRGVKIAIIVVLVLALIGAGVYLFLRWQESAEIERQAELDRLNQQSRDSLMDNRFKKQKGL